MSTFHLKGLNTYRGLAAWVVVVAHIELFKKDYGYPHLSGSDFFTYTGGHTAVILFFALSGYLITLLLLREKDKYRSVDLKAFYLRRIFRVWPLYYLVIFLSLLLFAYTPSWQTLLLCLTIFPNVAHALGAGWALSPQIWSIGVEEQFYLVWPFVVKKIRHLLAFLLLVFVFFTFAPHGILFIMNRIHPDTEQMQLAERLFSELKFNCMAVGGIFAVLHHRKSRFPGLLGNRLAVSYPLILLPFVLWACGAHTAYFTDELYAVLFAVSIFLVSTHPSVPDIDTGVTAFFGKISYGLYMYHWIILEILFRNRFPATDNPVIFNLALYGIATTATVTVAALSYRYIEKPLLDMKQKRYGR